MSNSFKNLLSLNFLKSKKNEAVDSKDSVKGKFNRSLYAVTQARLNKFGNYYSSEMSINNDTFRDGEIMVKLARDAEKNNPHVKKFLSSVISNVVGANGFSLYVRGVDYKTKNVNGKKVYESELDEDVNRFIQDSFWEWAEKGNCETSKSLTFTSIQELKLRELFRDGEFIILIDRDSSANDWGFRLKMVNLDRFDRKYNGTASNGNRIIMSIELDDNDVPVAYYLKSAVQTTIPGYNAKNKFDYIRYDASDVIHVALKIDSEQIRGISSLSAGLNTLNQITKYQEAEVLNAQLNACKMGFYTTNDEGPVDPLDIADYQNGDEDPGEFVQELEAGTINVLPKGYDFKETTSSYPQSYSSFMKVNLRTVSSAFNISYEELANDREGVSYSSIRAGLVADRDTYKAYQTFFVENFLNRVYKEWLKHALLNGAIVLPDGVKLPFSVYNKFKKHVWRGRGFGWVDPLKDIQASKEAVNTGMSSLQRECEKMGVEFQEIVEERVQELNFLKSKGLKISQDKSIMFEEDVIDDEDKLDK